MYRKAFKQNQFERYPQAAKQLCHVGLRDVLGPKYLAPLDELEFQWAGANPIYGVVWGNPAAPVPDYALL